MAFKFEGYDVISTHEVPITTALMGGKEYFKTIHGTIWSTLPPNVGPDQRFEVKGYGLPIPYSDGKRGKHIFQIKYTMPKTLSQRERNLWEEFQKVS